MNHLQENLLHIVEILRRFVGANRSGDLLQLDGDEHLGQ